MIADLQGIIKTITDEIKQYMDIAVVGMSGGADSTLVAILCQQALGAHQVYSLHLPATSHDEATFNYDSQRIAHALGIHSLVIPIGGLADGINQASRKALGQEQLSSVNEGNARARVRMSLLYSVSHHLGETLGKRVRVVGTGNLSEDFIGYDTKGGDALADIFPIGDLFKSEVYQLLDYFVAQQHVSDDMINRIPSAGLWPEQTDERELGYSYAEMEEPIRAWLQGRINRSTPKAALSAVEHFVVERHLVHLHKRCAPPVISVRRFCDARHDH